MYKLQTTAFKLMDILVILTMVFGAPMNVAAAPRAQAESPALASDKSDYTPGESAHITGAGFVPGDYVLAALVPDGTSANWATVTADASGSFASDSPALDPAGNYEVRAYASGWAGDWSEAAVATVSFSVTAPAPPTPVIQSNKEDYAPGEIVILTGSGFPQGSYAIPVMRPDGSIVVIDPDTHIAASGWDAVFVGENGNFTYYYQLNGIEGLYEVRAYPVDWRGDWNEAPMASMTFTDAGDTLEQCRNGALSSPVACNTASPWVTGSLNPTNSHYREGDSVPFRSKLSGLASGNHILEIQYDFTEGGGEHAYDYLTSFNRSETLANPCTSGSGSVSPCSGPNLFSIPVDPNLALASPPVSQMPGSIAIYDGTISNVQYFNHPAGPEGSALKVSVRITFAPNAGQDDVLIAWGGHVASQIDWGAGDSASGISGAPYHMRLLSLDGSGGNKDRSIQGSAIPPTPTITTQVSDSSIVVGQSITDTAALSGSSAVTGTVKFFVCGPGGSQPDCSTGGAQVGGTVIISGGSATSAAFMPADTGAYCFRAEYTPDASANYSPFNHTNTTTECFTAISASPTLTTTPNPASGSTGTTLNDIANLSGGFNPTGTITFKLYNPSDETCSGTPAFTQTIAVNGNGAYNTTSSFVANAVGTWRWTASYSGDSNNNPASSGCNDEQVTIGNASPALVTMPDPTSGPESVTLNDTASLSGGFDPTGTITFNLYAPSDSTCSGTPAFTQSVAVSGNGSYSTTGGFVANTVGTWRWTAGYSGDSNNNAVSSGCDDEQVTVTDIAPTIVVDKTANPVTLPEPGGTVTFTVVVTNTSFESVTLTSLTDNVYGDLNGKGSCATSGTIAAGASYTCAFDVEVSGEPGNYTDTATAIAADNEGSTVTAEDDATVAITDAQPSVDLTKSASPTTLPEPGGVFTFTLTITNTSVENVTITGLGDTNTLSPENSPECLALVGTTLTPGQSVSCSYPITHTDAGTYENTAEVTVADNEGNPAGDTDDETVTVTDVAPSVTIVKSASPTTLPEPGGVFTFTLTITNTSVETVTITALTDDNALSAECLALIGTTLAAGASTSCTYSVPHTDAGSYPNTASVTVKDNELGEASAEDSETVTVTDVAPSVSLDKSVDDNEKPEPGGTFNFTLTITNASVETVTITALTDDNALSAECLALIGTTLDAGASASCAYSVTHNDAGVYPNTASVTVKDNELGEASASDSETVTVTDVAPSVSLDKSVDDNEKPEPGGVFNYTLTITNNSVEVVEITLLTDDNALSAECLALIGSFLDPAESVTCSYTATFSNAGVYPNTASVTVKDNEGGSASDSDDETVSVVNVNPLVSIVKSVNVNSKPEPGGLFTFTLTITNDSNASDPLIITNLIDTQSADTDFTDCAALVGTTLDPGESASCSYSVTHTEAGTYANTATVAGEDDEENEASASDDETVTVTDVLPEIAVTKTADPTSVPETGGDVTFTFVVTNNSVEPVTITSLTDSVFAALTGDADCKVGTVLPVGGSCEFTYTTWIEGDFSGFDHDNAFTAHAEDNETNDAFASDNATVDFTNVAPYIEVTKTANPTAVPETGGDVTFTFVVTNASSEESVTIISLEDSVYGALAGEVGVCEVGTVLAAGASCEFSFTQWVEGDYSGPDHYNKFTAHAQDNDGTDASDDADATVDFTNVAPSIEVTKTADPIAVPETGALVTFTFVVKNTSSEEFVAITNLNDSDFGILAGDADCQVGTTLLAGASCEFSITEWIAGDFSGPDHNNIFTAHAEDNDVTDAADDDDATVDFADVPPTIEVAKTAGLASIPETGANVTFTFVVNNTGPEEVTLTSLMDDQFGDLNGKGSCVVPQTIPVGGSYTCSAAFFLSADDLAPHTNVVTAIAEDNDGTQATAEDGETVTFEDVPPAIRMTKTANDNSIPETGQNVIFTFLVENIGVEDVTLTSLMDDQFGDLDAQGDCSIPQTILIGGSYSCSITAFLSADDLASHTNVVTATAVDDDGTQATGSDNETVTFEDVLPDISIAKSADDNSIPENGQDVIFTFVVTNHNSEPVTLTSLSDSVFGDLNGQGDCSAPQTIAGNGGTYSCSVAKFIFGDFSGDDHNNVATAIAEDNDGNQDTAADAETVVFEDVLPIVSLDKSVDVGTLPEPGGVFTFTITITNASVESVVITALADNNALSQECLDLVGDTLAVGQSVSCDYAVTHTDAIGSPYLNTATVTVEDNEGNPASASDDASVSISDMQPTVNLTKTADPTTRPEPGGLFTFTLTITNTSVESVVITALTDTSALSQECLDLIGDVLTVGGSASCEYDVTYTDATGSPYGNTASVTVEDNENNPASASDDETVTVTDTFPTVELTKTVSPADYPEPGGPFTFTLTIVNPSVEAVQITALTDTQSAATDFSACMALVNTWIPSGGTASCQYTLTYTDATGSPYNNSASVTVADNEGNPASDSDDETVSITDVLPTVDLVKSVDDNEKPEPGEAFNFTLTITNTSVETVTITALTDTNALSQACLDLINTTLAAGVSTSCVYSVTHTDTGTYPNIASVTVEDNESNFASDSDDETVTIIDVRPTVALDKTVDVVALPEPGGPFTFTLSITNTAVEPVQITALADTQSGATDFSACAAWVGQWLAVNETVTCQYAVTHTSKGLYSNTANVEVQDNEGNKATDEDAEQVTITDAPDNITIVKTGSIDNGEDDDDDDDGDDDRDLAGENISFTMTRTYDDDDDDDDDEGRNIGFTITVTNGGPGTAYNVVVNDPLPVGFAWTINPAVADCSITGNTLTCTFGNMPAGATESVHIVAKITNDTCGIFNNTATVTSDMNAPISASASVTVYCDLRVSKTAVPTFTRTYNWSITKGVDKTLVRKVGGSATFNYAVNVRQTGYVDSNWLVTGRITVVNPNPTLAISGVNVTDSVNNGGSCTVEGGSGITIPAGGSVILNYTCVYAAEPTLRSGLNIARATWDKTAGTPHKSASGSKFFSFGSCGTTTAGNPTNVNKTITVTDKFNGSTTTLGTVTATTYMPYAAKTFNYSRTVSIPSYACKSYANTAKIVETGQSAGKTITVCGPINLGAKSKGFWQNKNGQNIIKQTASISGVCKLTPWLRTYAPFQDLSATASCTAAATYVYNIIKAADASGASMNAMLKAQMLAAALDVYYSDPALGGNKIGAPAPIGGVTVDLTLIKAGGGYQNVSDAFGGAASMTISQMLNHAAGQSNAGGSVWYGNVKSTQELAKNAFDAIDNNWVFAP